MQPEPELGSGETQPLEPKTLHLCNTTDRLLAYGHLYGLQPVQSLPTGTGNRRVLAVDDDPRGDLRQRFLTLGVVVSLGAGDCPPAPGCDPLGFLGLNHAGGGWVCGGGAITSQ